MTNAAVLRVQFYDPKNDSEGFINKVVASADPPFCHCELHLPNGKACSIYMNHSIHYRERTFSNPAYTCVYVLCTWEQVQALMREIEHLMTQNIEFSTSAMLGTYYGINLCPPHHTYCSKLVAELLQGVGVIPDEIDCQVISPSKLYRVLTSLPTHVPPQQPPPVHSYNPIDWTVENTPKLSLSRSKRHA